MGTLLDVIALARERLTPWSSNSCFVESGLKRFYLRRSFWRERSLHSVANLTRADAREFLELAPRIPLRATVHVYPLEEFRQAFEHQRTSTTRKGKLVISTRM